MVSLLPGLSGHVCSVRERESWQRLDPWEGFYRHLSFQHPPISPVHAAHAHQCHGAGKETLTTHIKKPVLKLCWTGLRCFRRQCPESAWKSFLEVMILKQTLCAMTPVSVSLSSQPTTLTVPCCLGCLVEAELRTNLCLTFSFCFVFLPFRFCSYCIQWFLFLGKKCRAFSEKVCFSPVNELKNKLKMQQYLPYLMGRHNDLK